MDILSQIGTAVGTEFKSLGSRVSTLESSGGVDSYSETTHTNGIVSEINTWSTSSKSNLVQTKSFTYTNGLLTKIVVKDGSSVTELTKTFTYDGDGNLASITKDYA
jgi:hypothetical protein